MHFIESVKGMKIRRIRYPLVLISVDLDNTRNILRIYLAYSIFESIVTDIFYKKVCYDKLSMRKLIRIFCQVDA